MREKKKHRFQSDNFCERYEDSRLDYTMFFADLQRWLDVCYLDQAAQSAEIKQLLKKRKGKDLN